ncbi:MAG: hypothetical protein ACKVQU_01150 [Burkholderiales bacterium]
MVECAVNRRLHKAFLVSPAIQPAQLQVLARLQLTKRNHMNKLIAVILAATFATVTFQAVAQDKKPSAEECKKDPKMKGCEAAKK